MRSKTTADIAGIAFRDSLPRQHQFAAEAIGHNIAKFVDHQRLRQGEGQAYWHRIVVAGLELVERTPHGHLGRAVFVVQCGARCVFEVTADRAARTRLTGDDRQLHRVQRMPRDSADVRPLAWMAQRVRDVFAPNQVSKLIGGPHCPALDQPQAASLRKSPPEARDCAVESETGQQKKLLRPPIGINRVSFRG